MPPRAESIARQHSSRKPASRRRRRSGTKALAASDVVLRGEVPHSILDSQLELLGTIMAWSPPRILVQQQAAFWKGFAGEPLTFPASERSPSPKRRTARASAKSRSSSAGERGRKGAANGAAHGVHKSKQRSGRSRPK